MDLALEETAKENSKSFDQKVLDNFNKVKRIKIKKGQRLTAEIKKKNAAQEKINMQALNDFYDILNTRDKDGKLVIPINKKLPISGYPYGHWSCTKYLPWGYAWVWLALTEA